MDGPSVRERLALDDGFRRYGNRLSLSPFEEFLPGAETPFHFITPDRDGLVTQDEGRPRMPDIRHGIPEIERRDVGRNGDFLVVRIDHQGALAAVDGDCDIGPAATRQHLACQKGEQ